MLLFLENDGWEKYLAGVIVLVILLVIWSAVNGYLTYRVRMRSGNVEAIDLEETANAQISSRHIYDVPEVNNYENVEDDHSGYTALKRHASGEPSDDNVYANLNQELKNFKRKLGKKTRT